MQILRQLATCSPEGKLRLTSDALDEIRCEALDEIESMDDGVEKLRMYLKYADFCNETCLDCEARDYYEVVLEETVRNGVIIEEYRELAEYAYQRYAGLTFSEDDYVWETVSQRIEQYRNLFEKNLRTMKREIKFNESKFLPYNRRTDGWLEKNGTVELYPFPIEGISYNIPPKIFNKSFLLEQVHLFYRSDEQKVILSQEKDDYPLVLTESEEIIYGREYDQFLINIELSEMGKGYVRVSLYEEGKTNPIKIDKFKPWVMCNPRLTFGYNFSLKAGNYFLLFDNVKVNMDEFNKYESLIGAGNNGVLKWRGSDSFSPSYYLSNGMLVLPFRVY